MAQWTIRREGAVAVLGLDDGKANAVTQAEFDSLISSLEELKKSDAGAVVLAGRAGYFSAGLNLKVLPTLTSEARAALITRFGEAVVELFMFPKPVVAAISGHALGAGAMFALAADVRIFADVPSKFGLNEVPGGLFVPTFGIELARASAPAWTLTQLVMHGRVISPAEAKEFHLAESVVPADQLMAKALERANQLAEISHAGYALTKKLLRGPSAEHARKNIAPEVAALGQALGEKK